MTADPAIAAAQRAWAAAEQPFIPTMSLEQAAIAAAREALTPLREIHYKIPLYLNCDYANSREHDVCDGGFESVDGEWCCPACTESDGGPVYVCAECREDDGDNIDWACATALLIYSPEELR